MGCQRLSRLTVAESPRKVDVQAFVLSIQGGACNAAVTPVFTTLHLASPLGNRAVKDLTAGQDLTVYDCREPSQEAACTPDFVPSP